MGKPSLQKVRLSPWKMAKMGLESD
jgi:hypothetical protein